jgi:ABC-type Na+ efflux pump permease subunit
MKGLLLKDYYVLQANLAVIAVVSIAIGAGMAFLISPLVLIVITSTVFGQMAASTITNDNTTGWTKFAVTLPVSRQQIISGKYLAYALFCLLGLATGIIISSAIALIRQEFEAESLFLFASIALIVPMISGSVMIPCNFVFREERAMLSMIVSYLATSALVVAYIFVVDLFIDVETHLLSVCGIGVVVSIVIYLVSWMISQNRVLSGTV